MISNLNLHIDDTENKMFRGPNTHPSPPDDRKNSVISCDVNFCHRPLTPSATAPRQHKIDQNETSVAKLLRIIHDKTTCKYNTDETFFSIIRVNPSRRENI